MPLGLLIALALMLCPVAAWGQGVAVPVVRPNPSGTSVNPSFNFVYTDNTMSGNGSLSRPLGLATQPVPTSLGGTGVTAPSEHAICLAEGVQPFSCTTLAQDEILQGLGETTDPAPTQNITLGVAGHLRIRNNPPAVDCPGSTGTTIVGNDSMFQVAIGSGTVTTCTVTFNVPMPGGALCKVSTSIDTSVFSAINPIEAVPDPIGNFVTLQGQTAGADIGCHTATVSCSELVQ